MNFKKINISLLVACLFMNFSLIQAQMSPEAQIGKDYFQGNKKFTNGGPGCVSCHNVTNENIIPGGLMAKDLTNVYQRMGEGITAWLGAPPFPAMISSYKNNPLTEIEKSSLTAFLKYADEASAEQKIDNGYQYQIVGGAFALIIILVLISLIWMRRKKNMTKKDIFNRQIKAKDAKF